MFIMGTMQNYQRETLLYKVFDRMLFFQCWILISDLIIQKHCLAYLINLVFAPHIFIHLLNCKNYRAKCNCCDFLIYFDNFKNLKNLISNIIAEFYQERLFVNYFLTLSYHWFHWKICLLKIERFLEMFSDLHKMIASNSK